MEQTTNTKTSQKKNSRKKESTEKSDMYLECECKQKY